MMKSFKTYILLFLSFAFFVTGCDEGEKQVSVEDFKAPDIHIESPVLDNQSVIIKMYGWYQSDSRIPRNVISTQCGFYIRINDNQENVSKIVLKDDEDYTYDSATNKVSFSKALCLTAFDSIYHVKAYLCLMNSKTELVSDEISFRLGDFDSYIKFGTPQLEGIAENAASIKIPLAKAKGIDLTSKTIHYGNNSIGFTSVNGESGTEGLSFTINDLIVGQTYQYWAEVKQGDYSAKSQTFEFIHHSVPSITTRAASNITAYSAVVGGQNIKENGTTLIEKGVVWSKDPNPSLEGKDGYEIVGSDASDFTYTMTDLTPATTYYVKAYAMNSDGAGCGEVIVFTTDTLLPSLKTIVASDITSASFKSGGNVTDNGGVSITARGIVWDTNENPTIALTTKSTDGSGVGSYSSTATDLQPNTVYYVRAYATNAKGTAYGEQITVKTLAKGENEEIGNDPYTW